MSQNVIVLQPDTADVVYVRDGIALPTFPSPDGVYVLTATRDGGTVSLSWGPGTSPPVPPAPVAEFVGSPLSGVDPLSVSFTDQSTNTPTAWSWEWNSGTGWSVFSTAENPSGVTFTVGTWDVRLTASNAGGLSTRSRTGYVSVASSPPPPPGYTPSLDFSDGRNSQYALFPLLVW